MKKYFVCLGAALTSMLTLTNCNREEIPSPNGYEGTVPFSITAGTPEVKTMNDGAFGTDWAAGDGVNLFYSETGKTSYLTAGKFSIAEADLETRTFRGLLASELAEGGSYDWYVVYPYNDATTAPGKAQVNVAAAVQTQAGDDNLAHIAGANYPVCGMAKAVAASASPEIAMQHLTSLVEVVVTNASSAPLTVSEIKFVAEEAIVGAFNVDVTKDAPSYSAAAADKVSSTATLNVTGAKELATGTSAKYYFAVKPFTAKSGTNLIVSVNGIERILEMTKDVTFTAGLKKEIKFEYDLVLAPEVTIEDVAFSCAKIRWTSDGLAKSFNIYVNGELFKEGLSADTETYTVTGLNTGVDNKIEVEAVADDKARGEVTVKTKGVRVLGTGRHHITIEWDEVGKAYNNTLGTTAGNDRGYMIGIYTDKECTNKVYEVCPYNALNSKDYAYGNSSYVGRVGGTSYYVSTRLALGSLDQNTTYYIRVRSASDITYTYSSTNYTVTNAYGNSEWSAPIEVTTQDAHQPSANEVIFADFDEFSACADRRFNAPGTISAKFNFTDHSDMRVYSMGALTEYNMDKFGMGVRGKGEDSSKKYRDYWNCKNFNVDYDPTNPTSGYNNYAIKEGYDLTGWHFTSCLRVCMGAVFIDRARNRVFGTPALTQNLNAETETECTLSFEVCAFANGARTTSNLKIWIYRDNELLDPVHTFQVTPCYSKYTDSSNYEVAYNYETKSFNLNLKAGDAVIIGMANESSSNNIVFDNVKIETK